MPTTPYELFKKVNLKIQGQVDWDKPIPSSDCGLYVVAVTNKLDCLICEPTANLNDDYIDSWIQTIIDGRKQILIDGKPANRTLLKERISKFWLPDETIIYIGKAGPSKRRSLRVRVNEFYHTRMGCDGRHAGGNWVNLLNNLYSYTVFYSSYLNSDVEVLEEAMLEYFMECVSNETRKKLYDHETCLPFANKEINRSALGTTIRKRHGIGNSTVDCGGSWRR